ncbi:(2Fe-2S)-binding protein [Fusibacter sp. JL216-2]|uniref:(2Fe-2S)-binding protein n=1 Tax=Fusibacter sp. JL216-2 TaxID=3071453 RepID=UPI003D34EFCE
MKIKFKLNGDQVETHIRPDAFLIDVLRDLDCLGVKKGCDTGTCGACTIHFDNKPMLSCVMLAAKAHGHEILTIEGVNDKAKTIGKHLVAEGVEQCGYCSPGTIMSILYLESVLTDPTDEDILYYLNGNLCRCSGYAGQLRAIKAYFKSKNSEVKRHETCA